MTRALLLDLGSTAIDRDAAFLVSTELGWAKPYPSMVREARVHVEPDDALMVGDLPISDLAGAQAAGNSSRMLRTCWSELPAGGNARNHRSELRS